MSGCDRVAAVAFLLLGGYVLQTARRMDLGTFQKPGPGFQPFLLGLCFVGLAAAYLLLTFRVKRAAGPAWNLTRWTRPLLASAAILFYWYTLTILGFGLATLGFLVYWLWVVERESWRRIALVSITATAGLYLVFTLFLRIRLPQGFLF